MSTFRSTSVTNTGTNVSTQKTEVSQVHIVNRHSAVIYVRFYNQTVATFQDTPTFTATVAASGGVYDLPKNGSIHKSFPAGLTLRVVTDAAENGNTAAATLPEIVIEYS